MLINKQIDAYRFERRYILTLPRHQAKIRCKNIFPWDLGSNSDRPNTLNKWKRFYNWPIRNISSL